MNNDSPTEAVAIITDLAYRDSLRDATHFVNFGFYSTGHYSPTEAVALLINLKFLDWLCDAAHFANFGICNMSPDSPTEAIVVITDLDYLLLVMRCNPFCVLWHLSHQP